MIKLIAVLIIASLGVSAVQTQEELKCGACMAENEVLCVSQSTYYFCFNGEPFGEEKKCFEGFVCSNNEAVCVPTYKISETIKNVCAPVKPELCGKCVQGFQYACVTANQAARCVNNEIATLIDCRRDQICIADIEVGSVCVPQAAATYLGKEATCNDSGGFLATSPAPTPSYYERSKICSRAAERVPGLYVYAYADENCHTALYCERPSVTSTDWKSIYRICSAPKRYFDMVLKYCVADKPELCNKITYAL
ncbi:PREDICTED: uncharacterized protein LOC108612860 [Drosophila arizonae]|uniref:Uncharacterized protein LOC108612860 n=1 Tax=Drosophila arizonae TaxID=7263 RepID=A0ABM1P2F9_DROAR|nr:PREDICTED: uncharacterized protein LOC108612860 [Drosophila arizonae]